MDGDTLADALRYPWDGGENGTTLVVGGLLTLLSPLVLPALAVVGYWLRVVEAAAGDSGPPGVADWGRLTLDGAKGAVVVAAYGLVPFALGATVVAALLGALGVRVGPRLLTPGGVAAVGGLGVVFGLLLAGLALVVLYVLPAALAHLARTRRLGAAFAYGDVRALAGADAYASAWLLALVVFVANGIALVLLGLVSLGLLGGFVSFYAVVAAAYLYGRGVAEAGFGVENAETGDESPAAPS